MPETELRSMNRPTNEPEAPVRGKQCAVLRWKKKRQDFGGPPPSCSCIGIKNRKAGPPGETLEMRDVWIPSRRPSVS
eukprot:12058648-Alexandrium_andersonii.AAC.1